VRHFGKLLLAIGLASPASAQIRTDSLEIASVSFPGARVFPERLLATTVATVPTQCAAIAPLCLLGFGVTRNYLDPRNLDLDAARVRLFYFLQGYRETRVTADTVRREARVDVQFRVEEGRPVVIAAVDVEAAEDSFPRAVARGLPLQAGRPLSMTLLEATRDSLIIRMTNRGYARADALANYEIPPDDRYTARVRYDIIPGPLSRFGDIEIVGAEKVDTSVVRRMLTFKQGDLFSTQALLESQRNLFDQAVFRHAEVRALDSSLNDTLVPVRVQVNEGALHNVRTALGVNTAEYLNGEVGWTSRSFRGGARRLVARATVANVFAAQLDTVPFFQPTDSVTEKLAGSLSVDFTQPWFLGPLNTFGAGAFLERQSIPGVFLRTSGGGYFNLTRRLGANTSASIGYRPEFTRLQTLGGNAIFCAGFTACGQEEIDALGGGNWLAPFAVSLVRNVSNSFFAPTRGYAIRLDAEIAGRTTFSDFSYIRLFADLTDYHTIVPGWVWALRLQPGYAREFGRTAGTLGVHPQKRFFAGGPNSVRGFPQYRLGPKVLTIDPVRLMQPADSSGADCSALAINDSTCDATAFAADHPNDFDVRPVGGAMALVGNAELRFPILGDNLRGAAFIDVGQVWRTAREVNLDEFAWTPGLGVRYFSPIGPIRVDIGYYGGSGETVSIVTSKLGRPGANGGCEVVEPLPQLPRTDYCDSGEVVFLDQSVFWQPRRSFFDRLQFHFSIGQAF
jgi:outer membrane protein assembly factor BamA